MMLASIVLRSNTHCVERKSLLLMHLDTESDTATWATCKYSHCIASRSVLCTGILHGHANYEKGNVSHFCTIFMPVNCH